MLNISSKTIVIKKWHIVALCFVLSLIIIASAFLYFSYEKRSITSERHSELKALADLKISQITRWDNERFGDAKSFSKSPFFVKELETWITSKTNSELKAQLMERISLMNSDSVYRNILVADETGHILLSLDTGMKILNPVLDNFLKQSLKTKKILNTDLYFPPNQKTIRLDYISPMIDKQNRVFAFLIFMVNPDDYLYPLISKMSLRGITSENLIVKREGENVLFLNELTHIKASALNLRIPLTRKDVPAVQSVLGNHGFFTGKDYNGDDVLSYNQKVPGTSWFFIAKVEKSEIFENLHFKEKVIISFTILLIVALTLLLVGLYSYRQKNIYKQLYNKEKELRESHEEFRTTLYSIGDGVITTDDTGAIRQMNKIAEDLTGWRESEAAGKQFFKIFKIINEITRKTVDNPVNKILKEGKIVGLENPTILISKTGREIPIADSGAPIINENGKITGVVLVFHDKTIEYNSENLIRKSEARLNRAELASKSGNWELHLDSKTIIASEGAEKIYGVELGQLSLDVVQKFVLPEYRPALDLALKNLVEKNKPYDIEFKIRAADTGLIKDIHSVAEFDSQNKILFGVIQDVTDRKKAQEALRENEAFLNNMLETIPVPVFFKDNNGKYLGVNKAFISLFGYTREQIIGKNVFNIYPLKLAEEYFARDSELILNGGLQVYESKFVSADGKYHNVVIHKAVYENNQRETAGLIGVILDITERLNAEEALKKSNSLYHDLVETSQDLIWQCDAEGRYTYLNHAWKEVLGYNIEEMLGRKFSDFQTPEYAEHDLKEFEKLLNGDPVKGLETVHRSKSGKEVVLVFNAKVLKDENGKIAGTRGTAYDRTEKKQAEEALIESERLLKESQAVAKLGSYVWDIATGIWKSSRILDDVLGIDENYIRSLEGWSALIHPEWQAQMTDYVINEVLGKKQRFDMEYKIVRHNDGRERWVYGLGELEVDTQGNPKKLIGTIQDITERKHAEVALRESEEIFNHFMEFSPIYVFFKDENIRAVRLSDNYQTMLGKPIYELLGKNMDDLFPSELAKSMIADDKRILKEGKEITIEEELNGRFYSTIKFPITIDGKARYLAGYTIDVTERKLAETALKESEEKLSALFASMTEMVVLHEIVFDEKGEVANYKIIDCNNAFTEITGIKKDYAVGKLATEVFGIEAPPYLDLYSQVAITRNPLEYVTYYAPMDKHFSISVVSPKMNQFATITTDITAIQQIQEVISAKNKELENYLFVSSHDLRSPLVNIHGFSQRLQKHTDLIISILNEYPLQSEVKEKIETITNESIPKTLDFIFTNVAKMENLINGLLQISRTGRVRMTVRQINMNELLEKIIGALDFQITEIAASVIVEKLPPCYGDENLLNQLFTNIITNAIKYRKNNRPLVINIFANKQYNKVIYSVKDNGIGIAERHHEKIWDVFYRVDSATPGVGDGIGLSIAKRITDKHRGKIWAESEEGKGSTFYIELQSRMFSE